MKTKRQLHLGVTCAVAAIILSAAASHAKVFSRWKRSGVATELTRLGAKPAYKTLVKINDSDAELEIYTWSQSFASAIATLRRTYFSGDKSGLVSEDGTAFGAARLNGRVVRMVITRIKDKCMIFRIDQSAAEYRSSSTAPLRHRLTSLPVREDSSPLLYLENSDSGFRAEMSVSQSDPEVVAAFFESSLKSAGWKRSPEPRRSTIARPAMCTYVKDQEVCCVFVARGGNTRKTYTTVLHRPIRFGK